MSFEANRGQANPDARYISHGPGYSILFTDAVAELTLSRKSDTHGTNSTAPKLENDTIRMQLLGGRKQSSPVGEGNLPGIVNYFDGSDSSHWHTGIPTFGKVRYAGVYPGVDLVYYGSQRSLEFDFEVAPGANARTIELRFAGARGLRLSRDGELAIVAANGVISFHKPVVYQTGRDGHKQFIEGGFRRVSKDTVSFRLGAYNHDTPLVIDPILSYSTYLGQSNGATAIAADPGGNAYITGWTNDSGIPVTPGVFQIAAVPNKAPGNYQHGITSAFVTKFNSSGTVLLCSTYLSGSGVDQGNAIAVDAAGNAYVAGITSSTNFPITSNPIQATNKAAPNFTGFISKLNSTGSALLYSTYLGGSQDANPAKSDRSSARCATHAGSHRASIHSAPRRSLWRGRRPVAPLLP